MGKDAPNLLAHNNEIASLERQVRREHAKLGKVAATATCGRDSLVGSCPTTRNWWPIRSFAEKAYVSLLSSPKRARVKLAHQHRYMTALVRPTLPENAVCPRRILLRFTLFAIALVLWELGVLIDYAIRDHGH